MISAHLTTKLETHTPTHAHISKRGDNTKTSISKIEAITVTLIYKE